MANLFVVKHGFHLTRSKTNLSIINAVYVGYRYRIHGIDIDKNVVTLRLQVCYGRFEHLSFAESFG